MKSPILHAKEIRDWDAFTIKNEPVSSLHLMERAASKCAAWIQKSWTPSQSVGILCGPGNNGGDGLVIARLLMDNGFKVKVYLLKFSQLSADAQENFEKLEASCVQVIQPEEVKPQLDEHDVYVDALFGTGLSREIEAPLDKWVHCLNEKKGCKIAIDMPSGVFSDHEEQPEVTIKVDYTLTFQCWKTAMMYPDNQSVFGAIKIMDIGLLSSYPLLNDHDNWLVREGVDVLNLKKWNSTVHKYSRGYVFIIAGSPGMKGARVLVVNGAQSVGTGMIEVIEENDDYFPVPEAITQIVQAGEIPVIKEKVSAIVCGSGLGGQAKQMVNELEGFKQCPVVFDADGINAIAETPEYSFPKQCVLTPHQGELKRLIGSWDNDEEMIEKTRCFAKEHHLVVVIKGALSKIVTPTELYVSTAGNNLLATAGTGDFLAGMIGGFAAQGYSTSDSATKGVYFHGKSADLWKEKHPGKFLVASDLSENVFFH